MEKNNLIGQVFGKLTVIKEIEQKKRVRYFICKCECGNTKTVSYSNLKSGHVQSCGCLRINYYTSRKNGITKKNTRLYRIWSLMKYRTNPNNMEKRHCYFERGITVCEEWNNSFKVFEKWALDNGYLDNLTIDRINNNKGYSPDNCRWTDYRTQENNRSNNVRYLFKGETHTLAEWSNFLGINYSTLVTRLRNNWTIEDAFSRPVRNKAQVFLNGENETQKIHSLEKA